MIAEMWTEETLDRLLTEPSPALIADVRKLDGGLMILGAGGKMGPTLAVLAKKAFAAAGKKDPVIAVSRFSDPAARGLLEREGVETISADLMEPGALEALPDAANIIFMAGRKFGTAGEEVDLATPCFNCIWQGDANEYAIRSLLLADSPAVRLNVTGPETVSVRYAAARFGELLGREVRFTGQPGETALLSSSARCMAAFGYPRVPLDTLIDWQAQWLLDGGRTLNKPTHFEERKGNF